MPTDADAAIASLNQIDQTRHRTVQAVIYDVSSSIMLVWGALSVIGYLFGHYQPRMAAVTWLTLNIVGYVGTGVILYRRSQLFSPEQRRWTWRIAGTQAALVVFGAIIIGLFWPVEPRQLNAFWPMLFMLGYVIAGLWVGRFFVFCGIIVTGLTLIGYHWLGNWFGLWMAAIDGGALLLGGLWLRRAGAAL